MVTSEITQISPSYTLPVVIAAIAIPLWFILPWLSGLVALFGMFLLLQAATLRLVFTNTALDIYRGDKVIRHFPYQEWKAWRIFYPSLPILFYFREIKSIHFLPMLFDVHELSACLHRYCDPDRLK